MARPEFRSEPEAQHLRLVENDEVAKGLLRLADARDDYVPSPVHRMQAGLVAEPCQTHAANDDLYPGWFRIAFPVAASVLLWTGIAGIAGLLS